MNLLGLYSDTLDHVAGLVKPTTTAPKVVRYGVKKVAVILSSSRAGSSYLKAILRQHPLIASLPGEEEPFLALTRNGFPFHTDSDALPEGGLIDPDLLAAYIASALQQGGGRPTHSSLVEAWRLRLPLQHLRGFSEDTIREAVEAAAAEDLPNVFGFSEQFLTRMMPPGDYGLYDIPSLTATTTPFIRLLKIEEPPFVDIPMTAPVIPRDIGNYTLLFKTPQNVYRPGLFEQLYPNAEIVYIHLTRGFAQTVNGLMDGWLSDTGFFAHNVSGVSDVTLGIGGYSDVKPYGKEWWKFDLPPNWREYTDSPLHEVCLNQWQQAVTAPVLSFPASYRVRAENLLNGGAYDAVRGILQHLGLDPEPVFLLPANVMTTEPPAPFRWRKREQLMLELAERPYVASTMQNLDYSMDPSTWR